MRDAMVALARCDYKSAALVHQHNLSLKTETEFFEAGDNQFKIVKTGMWGKILFTPISPFFVWHMRSFIKSFNPGVLHLHLPNPSAFWALFLPSARRLPWIVHWHADVITSAQDWKMKLFYKLYQPFERAVLKRAETIISTSEPYLASSQPLKEWLTKCKIVPLGVDVERFSYEPSTADAVDEQRPLLQVLAVGRLTYYKGFSFLIEAAAQAPGIHVNLVGHGDQADHLRQLTTSLKLEERVTFHGVLSDTELAQLMSDCDCLCLPSIERTEAFGMVLLEAMYFGKPTIVSDVKGSGMGWVVDDGVTGIKVEPANADSIASALSSLAIDTESATEMGKAGKQKFDDQFEINHAITGLMDIYRKVSKQ